ncbi:hypothetical protein [Streptomyces adustus]|uniref:hypothetical protein n=1 Tax=Streptomyces adustus TaxID=1609272 RepID=UPI0037104DB3
MAFPVLTEREDLGPPLSRDGEPLTQRLENRVRGFPHGWGYAGEPGTWYIKAVAASLLLPPQEVTGTLDDFGVLQEAFVRWSRSVVEWAAAWSQEQLMDFATDNDPTLYVYTKEGGHLSVSDPRSRTLFVRSTHPLDRGQLIGTLSRASRGDRLPVEHLMLLYAEDAKAGGDLRKAVIDAATAAEVALASYIRDRLKAKPHGLSPEFIDEMIKDVNGIANLYVLCKHLGGEPGVSSKKKVIDQLANVRNRAAHAGESPTVDQATTAIRHAVTIVYALRPLPTN